MGWLSPARTYPPAGVSLGRPQFLHGFFDVPIEGPSKGPRWLASPGGLFRLMLGLGEIGRAHV